MRKSIIAIIVAATAFTAVSANAATGLLTQDPNAPASNYDVIQDHAYQAAAGLANNAINHTQANAQAINTVAQGVGANAQAIGQTNASIGQTNQNLQSLTTNVGQNAQAIGQTNAQVGKNTQAIQTLQNQPKPTKGDKGDKGDTGAQGAVGAAGKAGANGINGKDGLNGKDGVTTTITKQINDVKTQAKVADNSKRIAKVEKQVAKLEKRVNRVGAMATASANLHYNRTENGYAVAVGEYAGQAAIAGGVQFNTSANTAITVQASYDGENVGASVGFHGSW